MAITVMFESHCDNIVATHKFPAPSAQRVCLTRQRHTEKLGSHEKCNNQKVDWLKI